MCIAVPLSSPCVNSSTLVLTNMLLVWSCSESLIHILCVQQRHDAWRLCWLRYRLYFKELRATSGMSKRKVYTYVLWGLLRPLKLLCKTGKEHRCLRYHKQCQLLLIVMSSCRIPLGATHMNKYNFFTKQPDKLNKLYT